MTPATEIPTGAHWKALFGYASLDPDPAVLIQAITNDYLTMRATARQAGEDLYAERLKVERLALALDIAVRAIEEAEHYCTPLSDWRCRTYNGFRDCNCWKSEVLARIARAKETGKTE